MGWKGTACCPKAPNASAIKPTNRLRTAFSVVFIFRLLAQLRGQRYLISFPLIMFPNPPTASMYMEFTSGLHLTDAAEYPFFSASTLTNENPATIRVRNKWGEDLILPGVETQPQKNNRRFVGFPLQINHRPLGHPAIVRNSVFNCPPS